MAKQNKSAMKRKLVYSRRVFSTALYASEIWTLKKGDRDKILALEMYCHRRMLHLSWTLKVKNVEICERLNIKEDLVQFVMKRKLNIRPYSQNEG